MQSAFKFAMYNHNLNTTTRKFELQAFVDVINTADAYKLSRLSEYESASLSAFAKSLFRSRIVPHATFFSEKELYVYPDVDSARYQRRKLNHRHSQRPLNISQTSSNVDRRFARTRIRLAKSSEPNSIANIPSDCARQFFTTIHLKRAEAETLV